MIDSWWIVLDGSGERIVFRTASALEAFRVARTRTGGRVRLAPAPAYGIDVMGRHGEATVLRVSRQTLRSRRRVAIFVHGDHPELVRLPDGTAFTWIPASSPARRLALGAGTARP